MSENGEDHYVTAARKLLAQLEAFKKADVDNPVGDDSESIKEEIVTEFLRQEFPDGKPASYAPKSSSSGSGRQG